MRPAPSAQIASIWESCLGRFEPGSFAMLLECQLIRPLSSCGWENRRSSRPVADRDQGQPTVSAATEANTRDLAKWHVHHAAHLQPPLV